MLINLLSDSALPSIAIKTTRKMIPIIRQICTQLKTTQQMIEPEIFLFDCGLTSESEIDITWLIGNSLVTLIGLSCTYK